MKWPKDNTRYAAEDTQGRPIRRGDLHRQLDTLLAENGNRAAHRKRRRKGRNRVGNLTQDKRYTMLHRMIDELRAGESRERPGMKLETLVNLKRKHADYLKAHWFALGQAGKTIDTKISMLRCLYEWVGKKAAVPPNERWLTPVEYAWVSGARYRPRDKTPRSAGLDPAAVSALIHAIEHTDERVAAALRLERAFGLRVKEALLFRPLEDTRKHCIRVRHGAKNGRPRTLDIDTDAQIVALDYAKLALGPRDRCLIPHAKSFQQGRNRYYNVLRSHGVTRGQLCFTSHGLRQEVLINTFQDASGLIAPVRGGREADDPDAAWRGHEKATGVAGHSRHDVLKMYGGDDDDKTPDERRKVAQEALREVAAMTPAQQADLIRRINASQSRGMTPKRDGDEEKRDDE
jgi:hypothetical protein